jgi:hypothetical protein
MDKGGLLQLSRKEMINIIGIIVDREGESDWPGIYMGETKIELGQYIMYRWAVANHDGIFIRYWTDPSIPPTSFYSAVEGLDYIQEHIPWNAVSRAKILEIVYKGVKSLESLEMLVSANEIKFKYGL